MILLLGGTSESLQIADELTKRRLSFILSVTTDYGEALAKKHTQQVSKQTLTSDTFNKFLNNHHIQLIIDATHPFARVISITAMEMAKKSNVKYIRFERSNLFKTSPYLKLVANLKAACDYLKSLSGTVYLSTGSKTAEEYAKSLGIQRLHIRVLPTERVLTQLTTIGFEADQIDAIEGPFGTNLNFELFKKADAVAVVTKESGRRGGVQEKITACEQLKIPCIIIKRPTIQYPNQVGTFDELWQEMKVLC
ncbi:precorrin-6A reductase [Lentilactobacillus raoultii]|uniref:Precorrin-6A reductase n=1 Tax=Lentilactobacillus raoultii TaxID=1987503 RepID=A0ABW3PCC3_9LACO|nr:precorrin-6A reductase [Lentilactobacillus raoultii]